MMKKRLLLLALAVLAGLTAKSQITDPAPYCSNMYDDWFEGNGTIDIGYIDGVELEGISNVSTGGSGQDEYKYFNEMSTDLTRGSTYEITITAGEWGHSVAAWIDFNRDNDFDDDSERLGFESVIDAGDFPKTKTITFTVPADAVEGETRLRVRNSEWDEGDIISEDGPGPNACDTYNGGETEDYNINIIGDGGGGDASVGEESTIQIAIYPNPASDQIWLEGVNLNEIQKVEVFALNGDLVMSSTVIDEFVNIETLNSGAYSLQVNLKSGDIIRERFIKN